MRSSKRKAQLKFEGSGFQTRAFFGGSSLKGNARCKRPLDTRLPIHLVLRADVSGNLSMRNPRSFGVVNGAVTRVAKKYGVRVYEYANVGNHLHILIKLTKLALWGAFIRELTGRIAQFMKVTLKIEQKFWLYRPFTRIIRGWKKPFTTAKQYIELNIIEAEGHISRQEIKTLKDLRLLLSG